MCIRDSYRPDVGECLRDEESRRHVQHRHIRRGSLGTADADRDESGSGDHRLRKIRVDKTGTQNYNTTKLRNRGYQRWTRCTAYRCTGTTIDSACIKVKTTILHRYRRWLCCTCVEDKAKGNHTGRKRNTPCGFSLPFFIHAGMTWNLHQRRVVIVWDIQIMSIWIFCWFCGDKEKSEQKGRKDLSLIHIWRCRRRG